MLFYLTESSWAVGTAIGVVGCVGTSCGLVVEKYSHVENETKTEPVAYYRQPWWLAGFLLFMIGQILNLVAMSMAPQTVLSCLGAMSLVFNALFATLILGEKLLRTQFLAMIGVIAGVILVVFNTPAPVDPLTVFGDVQHVVAPLITFEVFFVTLVLSITLPVTWIIIRFLIPAFMSIYWALVSALASGYTVTCFKNAALLFSAIQAPLLHVETYLVLGVAVSMSLMQVHTLNLGLKVGDAIIVVPTYFSLGMLAQLSMAELVYHELESFASSRESNTFMLGVATVLVSVVIMVRLSSYDDELDDEIMSPVAIATTTPLRTYLKTPTTTFGHWPAEDDFSARSSAIRRSVPRTSSIESLSPVLFRSSFPGEERTYTVSVTGPMGIA